MIDTDFFSRLCRNENVSMVRMATRMPPSKDLSPSVSKPAKDSLNSADISFMAGNFMDVFLVIVPRCNMHYIRVTRIAMLLLLNVEPWNFRFSFPDPMSPHHPLKGTHELPIYVIYQIDPTKSMLATTSFTSNATT
jgi:hypothetical protein